MAMAVGQLIPNSAIRAATLQRRQTPSPVTVSGLAERCRSGYAASSTLWVPGSVEDFGDYRVRCISSKAFAGESWRFHDAIWSLPLRGVAKPIRGASKPIIAMAKPVIQFIRGINEQAIPDVRLTRSRDGSNGVANFIFDEPSVFDSSRELGDITGIYMIDDEGVLTSVDVSAKFVNGKPARIEARYIMRNIKEWDRFMRFMERYAGENELGFVKS